MSSEIKVDTISENTSANGIAIDGLTLKDGNVGAAGTATSLAGIPFYNGDTTSIFSLKLLCNFFIYFETEFSRTPQRIWPRWSSITCIIDGSFEFIIIGNLVKFLSFPPLLPEKQKV